MLMKALLICPGRKPELSLLSRELPLAAVPMLGQSLVEYWLSDLAQGGVKEVVILASDRPEQMTTVCGTGTRWGLKVEILAEPRELTPAEALLKYAPQLNCVPPNRCLAVLDHFPGCAQHPLFISYAAWFKAVRSWLPKAKTLERVGIQEMQPGVFVGQQARISPEAELHPPCWIGKNVIIGERAIIGPRSIVEDGAVVDVDSEVRSSYIGQDTYVGRYAEIRDAIACGNMLLDWNTGVSLEITDGFILSSLRSARGDKKAGWLSRISDLYHRKGKQLSTEKVT